MQSPRVQARRLKDGWCSENHANVKLGRRSRYQGCFLSLVDDAAARSLLFYGSMKF